MIVRRLIFTVIGLSLAGAAAATAMVSAAFAVYALLRDILTPAGAAAAVVGFAAVVAGLAAVVVMLQVRPPKPRIVRKAKAEADAGLGRIVELVKERPFVSAAAAAAVGLLAVANPAIVTAAIKAFTEPKVRR